MSTLETSKPNLKSEKTCLTTNPTELNLTSQGTSTTNILKKTKSNIDFNKSNTKNKKSLSVKKSKIISLNKMQMYEIINRVKVLPLFKARNEPAKALQTAPLNKNIEPEKLFEEVIHSKEEIKNLKKEIKEFKKLYDALERENEANKYIISKIIEYNGNKTSVLNSPERELSNNNLGNASPVNSEDELNINSEDCINSDRENNGIDIKSSHNIFPKTIVKNKKSYYSVKKEKSTFNINNKNKNKTMLTVLQKELKYYDNNINIKEEEINKIKNNEKTVSYVNLNEEIIKKNNELENLIKVSDDMNKKIKQTDQNIMVLNSKLLDIKEEKSKIEKKIKKYEIDNSQMEMRIKILQTQQQNTVKDELKVENAQTAAEDELSNLENKTKELEIELKYNKYLLKEKTNYENELESLLNEEQKLKKSIELNTKKIENQKNRNEELSKQKNDYEKENTVLIEKSKIPQKNQEKMLKLNDEINKIQTEINELKKKNEEMKKKENNNKKEDLFITGQIKEKGVDDYEIDIQNLEEDIKLLNDEIIEKKQEKNNEESELKNLNEEYERKKNEADEKNKGKENNYIVKNENEEREYEEEKNKIIEEIKNMENEKAVLKKENQRLQILYSNKLNVLNEAKKKAEELSNILNEIDGMNL